MPRCDMGLVGGYVLGKAVTVYAPVRIFKTRDWDDPHSDTAISVVITPSVAAVAGALAATNASITAEE